MKSPVNLIEEDGKQSSTWVALLCLVADRLSSSSPSSSPSSPPHTILREEKMLRMSLVSWTFPFLKFSHFLLSQSVTRNVRSSSFLLRPLLWPYEGRISSYEEVYIAPLILKAESGWRNDLCRVVFLSRQRQQRKRNVTG